VREKPFASFHSDDEDELDDDENSLSNMIQRNGLRRQSAQQIFIRKQLSGVNTFS